MKSSSSNKPENELSVLILAAGMGTRMRSRRPKVLHEIAGVPMLVRVIDTALSLRPRRVGVVVGHGREEIVAAVERDVLWIEQSEQLGTGHAVQSALPRWTREGHTLILYGDVPLIDEHTLRLLIAAAGEGIAILTDIVDNPRGYGRVLRRDGRLVGIVEEKDASAEEKKIREINTGIMVLPNDSLASRLARLNKNNAQGEYYLTDLVAQAVADGLPAVGVPAPEHFRVAGVNDQTQLAALERLWQRHLARRLGDEGVTLRDPARFDLRGSLKHGSDVIIDVDNVFEGDCVLGDGVVVEPHCVLRNAVIGEGTRIKAFSHLENCVVGKNATIGPYARLRPEAELDDEVHVGNFVEIKKSRVGRGSKVNHLSYVGDAAIGCAVNIGAGTITCNYDGVRKARTEIGDDVFIGSGTMLVAPVKVGAGATTGAGSVITRDCPEGKLTLSRSGQKTVEAWKRPQKK